MQCLTNSNPAELALELVIAEKRVSLSKNLDAIHISELQKGISYKEILRTVRDILLYSARTFKYSEKMGLDIATTLAGDLIEAFKNDGIQDIILMLKMARQGQLGNTGGRLDADTLSKLLIPNYLLKKAEALERRYYNQKQQREKAVPMSEETYAKLDALSKRLGENQKMRAEENEKINPVLNHHKIYTDKLKVDVKSMNITVLKQRAEKMKGNDVFIDALKIIQDEINLRSK